MNPKVKRISRLLALVGVLFMFLTPMAADEIHAVQASIVVNQPTIYLPDYYAPGSNGLQISLRILDLTKPVYAVRLSLKIEGLGNGIVLETIPGSIATPITLAPYGTTLLTGSDLEPYFNPSNLSIRGMSRDLYNRTRTLPSGTYTFTVTAYDYQRPDRVPVSNTAFTLSRLQLAYPPEPLVPANKGLVSSGFISFIWTAPSGLGMLTTPPDYRLEIYELLDPSRKPEDETASAQPLIVRNVPMATTYPYNVMMESPQLIPGHSYAWRVQAVFADGRQVVDKNGYSRLNTFVYNSGAGALSRLTGFKAKAESQRIISASWNIPSGAELPDGYHLEFRITGNNSYEWFPEETTEPRVTIHNLEPSTEYELRVQTTSAGYRGDYSDGVKVTTPPPKVYTCDDSENTDTIITNFTPLMSLLPGEYFSNDPGFEFRVLRVTKSVGGVLDGACCVTIPWLGGTFACNFYGIKLNTDFRMLDGEVEILEEDLEEWIAKEKNNPTDLLSAAADALTSGYGVGHVITGDAATAVTTTWEGTPKVTKTGGEITVNGSPVSLSSTTGGFTVADASGKLYVVDEKGKNVTEVGKTAAGTTMKTYNERASSWNKLDATTKVTFTNNDALWKFDQYNEAYSASVVFTSKYEDLDGYRVPWKLIPEGKWGKVIAQLTGKVADPDRIIFRTPKGTEYKASRSGNKYELTLVSAKAGDAQEVYALYPTSDTSFTSLGKLQVATYAMQQRKLTLVPMVTKGVPKADALNSELTKIYRPYGIEWQVKVDDAFTDTSWDADHNNRLEADGTGLFSVYTSEMKALIKAYRTSGRAVDPATSYIFIVPEFNNSQSTLLGDMPLSQQFGFVTTGSAKPLAHTIAHELGHGAFQLYHTFDKYQIPREATHNLMDYTLDGGELVKYQWDALNDPGLHVGWLDKEGEGASVSDDLNRLMRILKYSGTNSFAFGIKCQKLIQKSDGIIIKIKGETYHVFFMKYNYVGSQRQISSFDFDENNIPTDLNVEGISIPIALEKFILLNQTNDENKVVSHLCTDLKEDYSKICETGSLQNVPDLSLKLGNDIIHCFDALQLSPGGLTLSGITNILQNLKSQCRSNQQFEFTQNGQIYQLNAQNQAKVVGTPEGDININIGNWSDGSIEMKMRVGFNADGILQFAALGIRKDLPLATGKTASLTEISQNMLLKGNALLKQYQVITVDKTPTMAGVTLDSDEFPDGKKVNIDENASFFKILCEAGGISVSFLKTAEVEQPVYVTNSSSTIQAPPIATGTLESVGMMVTDITSAVSTIYDIVTDAQARKEAKDGFIAIKDQVKDEPTKLFPILGEVVLQEFTGSTSGQYSEMTADNTDEGRKGHLVTKTSVRTATSIFVSGKFLTKLPDMAKSVAAKMTKAKSMLKFRNIKGIASDVFKNFENKLKALQDGGQKFLDDFKNALDGDLKKIIEKPELVDAWKKMDDLHADDALRKNPGALDALAKKSRGEIVSEPDTYLDKIYIDNHLKKFEGQVSTLTFENSINTYGQIGRNDGLFVLTKNEMDDLLAKTKGDISLIEKELGIPTGTWIKRVNDPLTPDKLVRVDINSSINHNLRMATGNEAGANELWIPGGKTPEGHLEAVIDPIPASSTNTFTKTIITK